MCCLIKRREFVFVESGNDGIVCDSAPAMHFAEKGGGPHLLSSALGKVGYQQIQPWLEGRGWQGCDVKIIRSDPLAESGQDPKRLSHDADACEEAEEEPSGVGGAGQWDQDRRGSLESLINAQLEASAGRNGRIPFKREAVIAKQRTGAVVIECGGIVGAAQQRQDGAAGAGLEIIGSGRAACGGDVKCIAQRIGQGRAVHGRAA